MVQQTLLGDAWDHAAVPVAIFGDDRRYIAFNEAFCRLTGYGRAELKDLVAGRDLAGDDESRELFRALVSDGAPRGTAVLKRKDGTLVPVEFWVIETSVAGLPYYITLTWPLED